MFMFMFMFMFIFTFMFRFMFMDIVMEMKTDTVIDFECRISVKFYPIYNIMVYSALFHQIS
jgi:hypothetical protein